MYTYMNIIANILRFYFIFAKIFVNSNFVYLKIETLTNNITSNHRASSSKGT